MFRLKRILATMAATSLAVLGVSSLVWAADGDPDTGFGTNGGVITDVGDGYDRAQGVAVQTDGKIVVVGYTRWNDSHGNIDRITVARYGATGILDNGFGVGGLVTVSPVPTQASEGRAVVLQGDGKIIVAGHTGVVGGTDVALLRFDTDGALDPTFGTGGIVTLPVGTGNDYARSVALQGDGTIVLGILSATTGGRGWGGNIARFQSNGTLDSTFGTGGIATLPVDSAYIGHMDNQVIVQADAKIIWAGQTHGATHSEIAIFRVDPNGTLDSTFGTGGMTTTDISTGNDYVSSAVLQSDGKVVVSGWAHGASRDKALVRYDTIGALDSTFGTGGIVTTSVQPRSDHHAGALALQGDGALIWAGNSVVAGNPRFAVARYQPDGTLDSTFGTGGIATIAVGTYDIGQAVALTSDGDIIVAGHAGAHFRDFNVALARLEGSSPPPTTTTTTTTTPPTAVTPPPPPPTSAATTTTTTTPTTTTPAPVTTAPVTTTPATTMEPGSTPSLVNDSNQVVLTRPPGAATALIDGVEIPVEVTSLSDTLAGQIAPEARSAQQVADLHEAADDLVEQLSTRTGSDVGVSVQRTDTGAMLEGVFDAVPVPIEDVIVVETAATTALFAAMGTDGRIVEVRPGAVLELDGASNLAVMGTGLSPGEVAELVIMSNPTLLDAFTVDADGILRGEVRIPEDLEAGDHTVVIAASDRQTSLGLKVTTPEVTPPAAVQLPSTGGARGVGLALVILGFGLAAVMVSRRRLV